MSQKDLVSEMIKFNSLVGQGRRYGNRIFLMFESSVEVARHLHFSCGASGLILKVLADFEEINPDLRITNWKPETHLSIMIGHVIDCYGVWIDFESKETPKPTSDLDHVLGQD